MGYTPKFIHFNHFLSIGYPFGVKWKHSYITQGAKAIYDTYKEDIEEGVNITFVAMGTSGAMIAGAMINELHHIDSSIIAYLLIARKESDVDAHASSLEGINKVEETRFVIVDDFIASGKTIRAVLQEMDKYFGIPWHPTCKYDMLCVGNFIDAKALKKNSCNNYKKWKEICSRFKYVVCCPNKE